MSDPDEKAPAYAILGLSREASPEEVRRAYLQASFALIKRGASDAEREGLKQAHDMALADAERRANEAAAARVVTVAEPVRLTVPRPRSETAGWDLFGFGSPVVDLIAVPIVVLVAILARVSPLGFLLEGFHVWIHEFGHATIAWLTGHRALPLPIGWTSIDPEKSLFVYFGVLFLFGVLAVAGVRERKPLVVGVAILLALLQGYMTWLLPAETARMWISFCGVGGEFYLSAAMMALFYVQLPEKFKWGICRYGFLFIGAASFFQTYRFWYHVSHFTESVPYGSLINGEDDANGDLDTLKDDFHWREREIVGAYVHLGNVCLIALACVYVVMLVRAWVMRRRMPSEG